MRGGPTCSIESVSLWISPQELTPAAYSPGASWVCHPRYRPAKRSAQATLPHSPAGPNAPSTPFPFSALFAFFFGRVLELGGAVEPPPERGLSATASTQQSDCEQQQRRQFSCGTPEAARSRRLRDAHARVARLRVRAHLAFSTADAAPLVRRERDTDAARATAHAVRRATGDGEASARTASCTRSTSSASTSSASTSSASTSSASASSASASSASASSASASISACGATRNRSAARRPATDR
jgi:hypothetical protein